MKKKKILIFIDNNCTAHGEISILSNIKVKYLPTKTTLKLQPLDQDIIRSFKVNYRKEVLHQFLSNLKCQLPTNIKVLDAMWMITKPENKVMESTILNCFQEE